MFDSITAAMKRRLELVREVQDLNAQIFDLKRDLREGEITDDEFNDQRLDLVGEVKVKEAEVALVDAWVEEERQNRVLREAEARAAAEKDITERKRLAAESAKAASEAQAAAARAKTERTLSHDAAEARRLADTVRVCAAALLSKNHFTHERVVGELRRAFPKLVAEVERDGAGRARILRREEFVDAERQTPAT